ncbi:MAG TPA: hypothetical protein VN962_21615 [Polyangia bacterium]|nr:hypothetical protein [Polyangia bacterium]
MTRPPPQAIGASLDVPTRLDVRATPASPSSRVAAVERVLIGVRADVPEARIRIADGGGGGAEIRLTVLGDGRTVAWQLLTPATGSRETLSDVMRQVRLRLRRRGIVLTGEQPEGRPAPRARRNESGR